MSAVDSCGRVPRAEISVLLGRPGTGAVVSDSANYTTSCVRDYANRDKVMNERVLASVSGVS